MTDQNLLKQVLQGILRKDPTLLQKGSENRLFGALGLALAQRPLGASIPEGVQQVIRYLPGDSRGQAQLLPGKQVLLNGKFRLSASDTLTWLNLEIPESGGAAGVTIIYARLMVHPEYIAGNSPSLYAGILPYAVRSNPGGSWYTTGEPYCLGYTMLWDDGAGTTAIHTNAFSSQKSQPLILRRDDVDGKFYCCIIANTGAFSDPAEVAYAIRCRVFRYTSDPLVKGDVPSISNQNIGALPAQAGADVEGTVVHLDAPGEAATPVGPTQSLDVLLSKPGIVLAPEKERIIRKMLGLG